MIISMKNTSLVEWICSECDRSNLVSIGWLRSKVKGTVMQCVGRNFSVSGNSPCRNTVTVGEVRAQLEGTTYARIPEHTQLPAADR